MRSESGRDLRAFVTAFLAFARWRAALAALLIAFGALFDGVGLLLLVPILDVAASPDHPIGGWLAAALTTPLHPFGPNMRLVILLGAFAVLVTLRCLVLAARDRCIGGLQFEFVEAIRRRLIAKMASAPWPVVARARHSRLVQALSIEIHQLGGAANSGLQSAVAFALLLSHCALALLLAPLAGGLALLFLFAGALLSRPYLKRAHALGRSIMEAHFGLTDGAALFLGGLKLAVAQGLQTEFIREYESVAATTMRERLLFAAHQTRLRNVNTSLAALVGTAALLVGILVFRLPLPILLTLLLVLSRMTGPASVLQQGMQNMLYGLPAHRTILRLEAELDQDAAPKAKERRLYAPAEPALLFRNVGFRHEDRAAGFDRLDLAIPAGTFVGIEGPSGVGKTTFLDLAAGILMPQAGQVIAWGRDLAGAGIDAHRRTLAYVAQDAFLFDDTVRRNLAWSAPAASEQEMLNALGLVGAAELIGRLEQGLDTRIGERGFRISAGERQRLALARALLRRPQLLILDEATNAIDIGSERALLEALAPLTPRTTILMVAHRRESLAACDHLLAFPEATLTRLDRAGQKVQVSPPSKAVLLCGLPS
jgi:ATP-binding cassette subfamily C protein